MSKVHQLWTKFSNIEREMELLRAESPEYLRKKQELLDTYGKIQLAETELNMWQTAEMA